MRRIEIFDGLRGLAVLLVCVSHFGIKIIPGGLGVEIFFVLSGFLITSLALHEAESTGSFSTVRFLVRRLARIVPPLLITLVMFICVTFTVDDVIPVSSLLSQAFFYHNYWLLFTSGDSMPGSSVLWSLAVEEHFYLIFPVFFVGTLRRDASFSKVMKVILMSLVAWRFLLISVADLPDMYGYYATDFRVLLIAFGCFMGSLFFTGSSSCSVKRDEIEFHLALIVLSMSYFVRDDFFRHNVRDVVHIACFFYIFRTLVRNPPRWLTGILNTAILKFVGKLSYTIYLCHYFIFLTVNQRILDPIMALFVSIIFIIGWSLLVRRFVEVPVKNAISRIT